MPPGKSTSSGNSPFASAQALDAQVCSEVGARLGDARDQRRLTHADVANRLLLSTAQVNGLERADASAFHNPAFFAAALRKYAALMGIDCPETILIPKSPPNVRAASGLESTAASKSGSKMLWRAVATVVLLAGASALTVYFRGRTSPSAQPAPTVVAQSPPPIAPVAPVAPIAPIAPVAPLAPIAPVAPINRPDPPSLPPPSGDGRAGIVTLARPAWVFVRYGDNSVTERTLQEGESLTLTSAPIYLAIGAGEGVTLTLRGRPIDVSPFRNGDEIRIRASELAALAP